MSSGAKSATILIEMRGLAEKEENNKMKRKKNERTHTNSHNFSIICEKI